MEAIRTLIDNWETDWAYNDIVEYDIDQNNVVSLWTVAENGERRLYAMMDKETFEFLRHYQLSP